MEVKRYWITQNYWVVASVLQFILYTANAGCPTGLTHTTVTEDYDRFCYQFVDKEKYWTDAQEYCLKYGGSLVRLPDSETNTFVTRVLSSLSSWKNKGVWIGLNDKDDELNWKWATEKAGNSIPLEDWTNWARGHPKAFLHSARDCVRMVRSDNWKWHETPCSTFAWKYKFICQYALPPPRIIPTPERQYLASKPQTSSSTRKPTVTQDTNAEPGTVDQHPLLEKDLVTRQTDVIVDGVVQNAEKNVAAAADNNKRIQLWAIISGCIGAVAFVVIILIMMLMKRRKSRRDNSSNFCSNPMYEGSESKPNVAPSKRVDNVYVEPNPSHVHRADQLKDGNLQKNKLHFESEYLEPTSLSQMYLTTEISKPHASGLWKSQEETSCGQEWQRKQEEFSKEAAEYEAPREEHIYAEIPAKICDN